MSVARSHAEWLSLVEASGPFVSMPVLLRVFPQGLDPRDPHKASQLREAYEDWLERGATQPAVHHAWIRHVLTELLEYPPQFLVEGQAIPPGMEAVMANFGETLRPDYALLRRADAADAALAPLLLIEHYAPGQDLEKPVAGKTWKASPGTRMMELLHAANVPFGLVTNGEQWMIVYAPRGETTGFASWYADLWMQEPVTLRAFHSLLHLRRFLGVAEPETLAALYAESSKDQQEVTNQLGHQVRRAVEMLVQAFDRIDAESGRKLLVEVREKDLYDSALTIMMRLVFLFSADERGLLLLGDPLYDQHYAVSTLSELLRERADQHGEEVLERRHDAWCRLLATFRAVHAGVEHEAMRLPPYGGTLFDPDRYPFLEGRAGGTRWQTTPASPLPVNNRVALHLLEALQVLRVKVPGGGPAEARRISFRALDIEQIGHVYEGLLDHTAKRASEVILGLAGSKDREPEIPLAKLEELAAKGTDILIEYLADETGRSTAALRKAVESPPAPDAANNIETGLLLYPPGAEGRGDTGAPSGKKLRKRAPAAAVDDYALLIACGQDPLLAKRARPFAALLRQDDFGQIVVIPSGSVYVTAGSDRRSTGTHYTPRSLTEPIVQHTLEPLVYIGPAEGNPQAAWKLKSPRELLALKVCDMTMGSGAFLVQACRYLAERLVEAWENTERAANASSPATAEIRPGGPISPIRHFIKTPEGDLATGDPAERLIPADPAERLAIARRYVADRCLYGVDINPMAVEMAKLSLWLITLQRDRPFTFLDHALKCGDSLLGVSSVQQIENFSLRPGERQVTFATANLFRYVDEASAKRRALEDLPSNDHAQIETKHRLHAEAVAATAKVKALADCLIAFELRGLDGNAYDDQRTAEAEQVQLLMKRDADVSLKSPISNFQSALTAHAGEQLRGREPFHWSLEFPEVFARGGFDAFVGNPPFMGGTKLQTAFGEDWREFLVGRIADGVRGIRGTADLCAYFLLRANDLIHMNGQSGFVATNTIAQGDTRLVGLDQIAQHSKVVRAIPSRPWPGDASLQIAQIWLHHGTWKGACFLDDKEVQGITPYLQIPSGISGSPYRLAANTHQCFSGSKVNGNGFILTGEEAEALTSKDERNRKVIHRYLTGDDINSNPESRSNRFVINFLGWPLDRMSAPPEYRGSVAADYPDCLAIVIARVMQERLAYAPNTAWNRKLRNEWWLFGQYRWAMSAAINGMNSVIICPVVTKYLSFVFDTPSTVFTHKVCVFALNEPEHLALLNSTFHDTWSREYCSTLGDTLNYASTSSFETFPFPQSIKLLRVIGECYYAQRRSLMLSRQEGLTKTYNRFHDRGEHSEDVVRLRALHVELDQAVAAAYGWSDLDLEHGFHATKQGERYTLSEPARRTVLVRLLHLNHQRYAEEVAAGLHNKDSKQSTPNKKKQATGAAPRGELIKALQPDLFD